MATNKLTPEDIRLLEALLASLSTETDTRKGMIEVEAVKDADAQVYEHLSAKLKQLGIKPTPERIQGLFNRLVHKEGGK